MRASSASWRSDHFAFYAIDEEPHPTMAEKWMAFPTDRARWVEVLLPAPATPGRVEIDLVSRRESSSNRPHHVVVICARGAREVWQQRIAIESGYFKAPIDCPAVDRVRVQFEGGDPRLYELRLIDAAAIGPPSLPGSGPASGPTSRPAAEPAP